MRRSCRTSNTRVVSAISTATVQELRAAGEDYPDWVRRRYLQLPRSVPTARDRPGPRRDQRRDLGVRPSGEPRDVPARQLHLLDPRRAACRPIRTGSTTSCSIPSRAIATISPRPWWCCCAPKACPRGWRPGFAPGDFDPDTGISTVRENHAHSWVEAYFPRYGWITFEPSAIRPIPHAPRRSADRRTSRAPPPAPDLPDASGLTPDELDELLNMRDHGGPRRLGPFLTTWPGVLVLLAAVLVLVFALIAAWVRWRCLAAWARLAGRLPAAICAAGRARRLVWQRCARRVSERRWRSPNAWAAGAARPLGDRRADRAPTSRARYASRTPGVDPWPALAGGAPSRDARAVRSPASAAGLVKTRPWRSPREAIPSCSASGERQARRAGTRAA